MIWWAKSTLSHPSHQVACRNLPPRMPDPQCRPGAAFFFPPPHVLRSGYTEERADPVAIGFSMSSLAITASGDHKPSLTIVTDTWICIDRAVAGAMLMPPSSCPR